MNEFISQNVKLFFFKTCIFFVNIVNTQKYYDAECVQMLLDSVVWIRQD